MDERPLRPRHRLFSRGGRSIPALTWSAADPACRPQPIVLVAHGGSGHKGDTDTACVAERLACELGALVLAIDGPVHGERRENLPCDTQSVKSDFRSLWRSANQVDEMVADWSLAIDRLADEGMVISRCGWFGISMGTAYGIPLCASDARIRCAVFGHWGVDYPNNQVVVEAADRIRCAVHFQQNLDDHVFPVPTQDDLYNAIASPCKEKAVFDGGHSDRTALHLDAAVSFLKRHL